MSDFQDLSYNNFTINASAWRAIHTHSQQNPDVPQLRISIQGGGCSGLSYIFNWEKPQEHPNSSQLTWTQQDLTVVIDKTSLVYLNDAVLDYERTLLKEGFIIHHPHAISCGCGTSFALDWDV